MSSTQLITTPQVLPSLPHELVEEVQFYLTDSEVAALICTSRAARIVFTRDTTWRHRAENLNIPLYDSINITDLNCPLIIPQESEIYARICHIVKLRIKTMVPLLNVISPPVLPDSSLQSVLTKINTRAQYVDTNKAWGSYHEDGQSKLMRRAFLLCAGEILAGKLTHDKISEGFRGEAVIEASKISAIHKPELERTLTKIVRTLLFNGKIADAARDRAFIEAVGNKHVDIVNELLEDGSISDDAKGGAVSSYCYDEYDLLRLVLRSGDISEAHRYKAVLNVIYSCMGTQETVKKAHLLCCLKELLTDGDITQDHREEALKQFNWEQDPQILAELIKSGLISTEMQDNVTKFINRLSDKTLVEMLKEATSSFL